MAEVTTRDGVCQCRRDGARWLGTGPGGGYRHADAAYNVTVPEGFDRTDLAAYVDQRRRGAGFEIVGPGLLTGVDVTHARCARVGSVTAVATVGLSNPATLPLEPSGSDGTDGTEAWRPGTVNLLVVTEHALGDGPLAELLTTCVEAKAATLTQIAGVSGTTSDAAFVGTFPDGAQAAFAGSATAVGASARACVRDAIRASFTARYADSEPPDSVDGARHGVVTNRQTDVCRPRSGEHD